MLRLDIWVKGNEVGDLEVVEEDGEEEKVDFSFYIFWIKRVILDVCYFFFLCYNINFVWK